jgi:hypothetical protein
VRIEDGVVVVGLPGATSGLATLGVAAEGEAA